MSPREDVLGEVPPRQPRYRRLAALAVLIGGLGAIATTVSPVKKEPATVRVTLPIGIRGLRMDVHRAGSRGALGPLAEHLEWTYAQTVPDSQEAALELAPGKYQVTLHALGASLRDPAPLDLEVRKDESAKLNVDLRRP